MVKIIFVIDYLTMRSGGPRFLIEVLRRLAKKGYEVHVITGSVDYTSLHINDEINVINLNTYDQRILPSDQPINAMKFIYKATKVIRKTIRNDMTYVLHLNSHLPNLIPYMVKLNTPVLCTIHHLEEVHQIQGLVPKIAKFIVQDLLEVNAPCTILHVPSRYTKHRVTQLGITNKHNIIVIPPGIEVEKYSAIPRRAEENLFVMVGRLEKRKHYEHAIMAFKIAVKYKPEINLIIIGDGPLKSNLVRLIKDLSLEKNVTLLGAVDEQTKLDLLSRAQALIHLGYPEGFGIVIVEALAMGVPVVTYNVPPMNEIIVDKVHGVLVEKDNIGDLAKTLVSFDEINFNYNKLVERAKDYDIKKIVKQFDFLYRSLLGV